MTCEAMCWMDRYARDAVCDLPADHEGPHVDAFEGWEW